jgi:4-hydroxybenzoate polyprenyltransferase
MRPDQWVKNLFVFLPLFFSANIRNMDQLMLCVYAFAGFSFVASSIYCMNDAVDAGEDRIHPEKSKRPVASGKVSVSSAAICAILLFAVGISVQIVAGLHTTVIVLTLLYAVMNVAYAFKLKQMAIIDVTCIALGFVFRVVIGGFAADVVLSHWIVLMTFLLALFLACAKRRDDVLYHRNEGVITRKNIVNYNVDFLNAMMIITATVTLVSYIMYTVDKEVIERFHDRHYIYATSIFVIAAIFRYLQIAMVEENSGNPTKIFLRDRFVQASILGWIIAFVFIIYF